MSALNNLKRKRSVLDKGDSNTATVARNGPRGSVDVIDVDALSSPTLAASSSNAAAKKRVRTKKGREPVIDLSSSAPRSQDAKIRPAQGVSNRGTQLATSVAPPNNARARGKSMESPIFIDLEGEPVDAKYLPTTVPTRARNVARKKVATTASGGLGAVRPLRDRLARQPVGKWPMHRLPDVDDKEPSSVPTSPTRSRRVRMRRYDLAPGDVVDPDFRLPSGRRPRRPQLSDRGLNNDEDDVPPSHDDGRDRNADEQHFNGRPIPSSSTSRSASALELHYINSNDDDSFIPLADMPMDEVTAHVQNNGPHTTSYTTPLAQSLSHAPRALQLPNRYPRFAPHEYDYNYLPAFPTMDYDPSQPGPSSNPGYNQSTHEEFMVPARRARSKSQKRASKWAALQREGQQEQASMLSKRRPLRELLAERASAQENDDEDDVDMDIDVPSPTEPLLPVLPLPLGSKQDRQSRVEKTLESLRGLLANVEQQQQYRKEEPSAPPPPPPPEETPPPIPPSERSASVESGEIRPSPEPEPARGPSNHTYHGRPVQNSFPSRPALPLVHIPPPPSVPGYRQVHPLPPPPPPPEPSYMFQHPPPPPHALPYVYAPPPPPQSAQQWWDPVQDWVPIDHENHPPEPPQPPPSADTMPVLVPPPPPPPKKLNKAQRRMQQQTQALYNKATPSAANLARVRAAAHLEYASITDCPRRLPKDIIEENEAMFVAKDLLAWDVLPEQLVELGMMPELAVRVFAALEIPLPPSLQDVDASDAALHSAQQVRRDKLRGPFAQSPAPPPPPTFAQPQQQDAPLASTPALTEGPAPVARVVDKSRELEQNMEEMRKRIAVLQSLKKAKAKKAAAAAAAAEATPSAPPTAMDVVPTTSSSTAAALSPVPEAPSSAFTFAVPPVLARISTSTAPSRATSSAPTTSPMDVDADDAVSSFLNGIIPAASTSSTRPSSRGASPATFSTGPRPAKRQRPLATDFEDARPVVHRASTSFARLDLVTHPCVIEISDDESDDEDYTPTPLLKEPMTMEEKIAALKAQIAEAERKKKMAKASTSAAASPVPTPGPSAIATASLKVATTSFQASSEIWCVARYV
ncbi:hypothetical protein EXIGLDRAFT_720736 [Exidia glandulosa HHB12029]|uniref:Uncharacterized protein n=1 Tax=Exidia glandulosa HHB12029 TaxID=1314781 RepID=A0A165G701_EXIGL|nr:hypothetical protein EXIGLDRAFT_720736 [Exidia glandulosa HHB12029]